MFLGAASADFLARQRFGKVFPGSNAEILASLENC
jgi:hypothetical protein